MKNQELVLSSKEAFETNYETIEFKLKSIVHREDATANRKIRLVKGTNILSIDCDVKVTDNEIRTFVERNFQNQEIAYSRIASKCGLNNFTTIF